MVQVSATDFEAQGGITYGIVTGSTDDLVLDPDTGILRNTGPLDREAVPQYILTVEAVDDGGSDARTSYTQVTLYMSGYVLRDGTPIVSQVIVTVRDVNDETPTFPLGSYTYSIFESFPVSSPLTPSPTATDRDLGSNADLQYSLLPPTSADQPFSVDSSTGTVTLTDSLDRETTSTYTLTLQAEDQGSLPRTGTTELRSTENL